MARSEVIELQQIRSCADEICVRSIYIAADAQFSTPIPEVLPAIPDRLATKNFKKIFYDSPSDTNKYSTGRLPPEEGAAAGAAGAEGAAAAAAAPTSVR
jgi:hypothetical protein